MSFHMWPAGVTTDQAAAELWRHVTWAAGARDGDGELGWSCKDPGICPQVPATEMI